MQEMICLVSGASSGLGNAMALGLAKTGATVVMLCRDRKRGRQTRIRLIAESGNPNIDLVTCDLSNLSQVIHFAAEFKAFYPRLDILANLAGIRFPLHRRTGEGFEYNLAANLLGPHLLTTLLMDRMLESAPATILNVSGEHHRYASIHLNNLQLKRRFFFADPYGQSALARVVWTYELSRRLEGTGVTANTFCPSWTQSNLMRYYTPLINLPYRLLARFFANPPDLTMNPVIRFTLQQGLTGTTGKYMSCGKEVKSAPISYDSSLGRKLWHRLEELTGTIGSTSGMVNEARAMEL